MSALPVVLTALLAIRGTIRTPAGQPIPNASVSTEGAQTVTTDASGAFVLDTSAGTHVVRVTRSGFQSEARRVDDGADVTIELAPALADTIVVSGIRAEAKTPVTKSDLTKADVDRGYYGQDMPLLLRDTPSINAYTESGVGGSGYSYVTLRGVSPTRINFTLDGVPLMDSEDMGTYFADFPDLAHSLQSIQVQRGVGTSTVGSPSFGGSMNFQSVDLSQTEQVDAQVGGGSFGSRFGTVGYQSGALPGGFNLYARLSLNESDGFRESSGIEQHNLFASAAKQTDQSQLKLTGFTAHERSQLAFFAADADTLAHDLRANPLTPADRDSYGFDMAQLQYLRALSPHSDMTASAYYTRGYGWYRLDGKQYGTDGLLAGAMATMSYTSGPWTANYGLHANEFRREHTRDDVGGPRDYYNYGTKGETNAFAKLSWDAARWHVYGDAQVRWTNFHYHGDVAIDPISWTFFNPKLGARYELTPASSVYASAGLSTREPTRNDLFQGEDDATFAHDLHAVKPERLLDVEAGWNFHTNAVTLAANVYAMEFRNEIASTGELSDIGLLLRRNVDRSYRRGVELDASWQLTPALHVRGNANVSRNRIREWTQFYDVYDDAGNVIGSQPLVHRNVNPVLTPERIANASIDYSPMPMLTFGAVGRYVSKSYLDNTNNDAFTTPSFTTLDASVSVALPRSLRLTLRVNNVFNNDRVYASGYSYLWLERGAIHGTSYYFPQATRNAVVLVDWKQ